MPFIYIACSSEDVSSDTDSMINETSMAENHSITLVEDSENQRVDVYIEDNLFTSYLYTDEYKKPILYPLIAANGSVITRGFPIEPRAGEREDHPHQVGLWLNYGDVNGLDFWNNSNARSPEQSYRYGTIYHKSIDEIENGDEGKLVVSKEWRGPDDEILLVEHTSYLFRDNGSTRFIDRITTLTAHEQDVALTDNKEGMLGIRIARELEHPDQHDEATGIYLSSEGLEGHDVWGTRGKWMNLTGKMDGESISVAILDHPDNVGFPTYWHARGYGLYAANPLGMKEMSDGQEELNYSLSAGESLTYYHRIIINSGDDRFSDHLENEWNAFVQN